MRRLRGVDVAVNLGGAGRNVTMMSKGADNRQKTRIEKELQRFERFQVEF